LEYAQSKGQNQAKRVSDGSQTNQRPAKALSYFPPTLTQPIPEKNQAH